jgi:hypothetical protein
MPRAVGLPGGSRMAAKVKIWVRRITMWPPAGGEPERDDFFGNGQARIGERGGLGRHQGGRRWLAKEGCRRFGSGVAVGPGRDEDGDLLDLGGRHHSRGEKAEHNVDSDRSAASAAPPAPNVSWIGVKELSDAALGEAKRVEGCADLDRRRRQVACFRVNSHDAL